MLDISGGEETLFEGMEEPVAVEVRTSEDFLYSVTHDESSGEVLYIGPREGYVEQDIEYSEETKDGQGYVIETILTLPRIGREVPAADVINGKIRGDAKRFYEEQLAFHEMEPVRKALAASGEDQPRSKGCFCCHLAYADEDYVSIVYKKSLHIYSQIYEMEYMTRLYSAKTGEELQPQDLFGTDWEEASLRLSFLIRRTELAFEFFGDDLFPLDDTHRSMSYCLTENGLDVFWAEDIIRFVEAHFIIPYEELEDIWAH